MDAVDGGAIATRKYSYGRTTTKLTQTRNPTRPRPSARHTPHNLLPTLAEAFGRTSSLPKPKTMAPPLQDLRRIALGLSLVAEEALSRSPAFRAVKSGDFPALLSSALLSAADLAGISKGKVRPFSPPQSKESVVFFADPPPIAAADPEPAVAAAECAVEPAPESGREEEVGSDAGGLLVEEKVAVAREQEEGFGVTSVVEGGQSAGDGGVNVAPLKRRKPLERHVPSTPFTRALG